MFRLSCPRLVEAIDNWEGKGAVAELNAQVAADANLETAGREDGTVSSDCGLQPSSDPPYHDPPTPPSSTTGLAQALDNAQLGHATARLVLVGEERVKEFFSEEGGDTPDGRRARLVLRTGVAGQVLSKRDVKCLHAMTGERACLPCSQISPELPTRLVL